jgi:tetratricopeptide (TPR) repeat protein
MPALIQEFATVFRGARMRRVLVLAVAAAVIAPSAGMAQIGGMEGRAGQIVPHADLDSSPREDKPDVAATKAYKAGIKALAKAREYEAAADKAANDDKRAAALEKAGDAYSKALDEFTQALISKADMYQAWSNVGYVHFHLGAYAESVDDYNHALALKPEYFEAIESRAEAYLALNRLDDVKGAYLDLYSRARGSADTLMLAMQRWAAERARDAHGLRPAVLEAFGAWLQERERIAKQPA